MKSIARTVLTAVAITVAGASQAQSNGSAQFIVPFSPGGPTDVVTRILSDQLSTHGNIRYIVVNKPGASGNIGSHEVARGAADGQTLLLTTDTVLTVNPFIFKSMPFDPMRDLRPVATTGGMAQVLVVNPAVEANSLKEFIALSKRKPMHYANGGSGGPGHLTFEALLDTADFKIEPVSYKGNAPAVTAILSGEVQAGFAGISNVLPHIKAGKLRALAVSTAQRSQFLPDVPTVAEAGYKNFDVRFNLYVMVPAATPDAMVQGLQKQFETAMKAADTQERFGKLGLDPVFADAEQTRKRMMEDRSKWKPLVEKLNLTAN